MKQFCQKRGITQWPFYAWRKRLREDGTVRFALVERGRVRPEPAGGRIGTDPDDRRAIKQRRGRGRLRRAGPRCNGQRLLVVWRQPDRTGRPEGFIYSAVTPYRASRYDVGAIKTF